MGFIPPGGEELQTEKSTVRKFFFKKTLPGLVLFMELNSDPIDKNMSPFWGVSSGFINTLNIWAGGF